MRRTFTVLSLAVLVAVVPLLAGCGDDGAPSSHTVSLGGTKHHDGYNNPLVNCVGCHGATLRGGSGPSCYSCHNNNNHPVVRAGVRHQDPSVDCTRCHGPNNTGGLGPACTKCHPK